MSKRCECCDFDFVTKEQKDEHETYMQSHGLFDQQRRETQALKGGNQLRVRLPVWQRRARVATTGMGKDGQVVEEELKEYLVQLSIKVIVLAPSEEDAVVYAAEQAHNGAYTETFEWDATVEFVEEVPDYA